MELDVSDLSRFVCCQFSCSSSVDCRHELYCDICHFLCQWFRGWHHDPTSLWILRINKLIIITVLIFNSTFVFVFPESYQNHQSPSCILLAKTEGRISRFWTNVESQLCLRQTLADSSPGVFYFIVLSVTFFQFACGSLLSCFLSCRTPAVLQDTLVLDLLYSEAGQSLLNILGTGVDTVDKLVSLGRYDAGLKKCLNSSLPYG